MLLLLLAVDVEAAGVTTVVTMVALVVTVVAPPHLDLLVSLADLSQTPPLPATSLPPEPGEALVQVLGRLEVGKGSSPGGVRGHVRALVADATTNADAATAACARAAVPPMRNEEAGQAGKGQKAEDRAGQSTGLPVPTAPTLVVDPVSSAVGVAPCSAACSASRHPRHADAALLLLLLLL